jgi:hypothetical protein
LAAWCGYFWCRRDALLRWSLPLVVVLGVAWITFLQPAAIGWACIAAAAACRFHPSLRKARERRSAAPIALRLAR